MKTSSPSAILAFSAAIAVVYTLPMNFGTARPGGVYKGTATGNALEPVVAGPAPILFDAAPIQLRLPNGKGGVRGTLFTSNPPLSAPADVPITGRVKKSVRRQGGKKYVVSGKWTWDFAVTGISKASGPFKIIIKKSRNGYRFKPAERVKVKGPGPPEFTYTSKINAKK